MARKTKDELIAEAHALGLNADEDEHYDDIRERVKAAQAREEEAEARVEEAEETLEDQVPTDPQTDQRTTSGWNSLGQWVGVSR